MRLDRLDLTRYGRFTDRSLAFASPDTGGPDLHIVYGANEAGKSTLFSAWLDLLFGIPVRTRYDFLHAGPTMQIGARLTHGGGTLDLKRLKRNSASLFDSHDAPIPEAVLHSALGGLSRDGYAAMFSLDDETLEKGGDGILASRGDLGEMLFSASAGLASLAPRLDSMRAGLDGFHRSGKRSGWLHDAKKQLAELDRQRRDLDVSAGTLQKLVREAIAAEEGWRTARSREEGKQAALDRLQEIAGTLPLLARLAGLQARLAPLMHLPDAPPAVQETLERIQSDRLQRANRIRDRAGRIKDLEDQRAALSADPTALAQAGAIELAEALRPEHDTAVKDLPRRRDEAAEVNLRIDALLVRLGRRGSPAADLCIAEARISALRARLTERSGLQGATTSTAAETRKAADLLDRERERLGDPGPSEDDDALVALLAHIRTQNPAEALARALREQDQAQARLDAAIAALAPWTGAGDRLATLAVPASWQVADWAAALDSARQEAGDLGREISGLRDDLGRLRRAAAEQARGRAATGMTVADAAAARSRREALWAAHLDSLSAESAHHFEQALREDDRISALLAEAMAEARQEASHGAAQAAASVRLEAAEDRLDAVNTTRTGIEAAILAACTSLGLQGAGLPDLRRWLDLRLLALAAQRALGEAQTAVRRCEDAQSMAGRALGAALGTLPAEAPETFETLFAVAIARIEAAERRREARRRLAMLASDLRERQRAEQAAVDALDAWRQGWADASRDSLLAEYSADDPGLGSLLDLVDQLGAETRAADALKDRIAKMEANLQRFATARESLLQALDQDAATGWADVMARLRRAEDAARDQQALARQIAEERRQDGEDRRVLAALDAEAAALGAALHWSAENGSLAEHVAHCRDATTLRQEIDALRADLHGRATPSADENAESIRLAIAGLKADLQILRDETETRLAAHLDARRRIEAVGGDDALARIASDRENLLLDIRDRAQTHLAARFGLMALEAGLRRYRDTHRSEMLTRASDAFRRLSRGAYSGLAAQPDGAQEVLVALPAAGGAKLAADLSKGTRFQLYLSLRIAGYHELAKSRPTVPFIADDIMETFDDDRSGAAFALLAEMSRVGQVIYLTHHRHLCDIARRTCPAANIITLETP